MSPVFYSFSLKCLVDLLFVFIPVLLLLQVWSVECMVYYGEQMRAGKKLPSPYENVHDDVNQVQNICLHGHA